VGGRRRLALSATAAFSGTHDDDAVVARYPVLGFRAS
jgi:hypothetical protein